MTIAPIPIEIESLLSYVLSILSFTMGLLLVLIQVPPIEKLGNYKSACRILGIGFMIVSPLLSLYHASDDWHFTQNIILLIASLLAFACTYHYSDGILVWYLFSL